MVGGMGRWVPWGHFLFLITLSALSACGTADNRVDPGDLELRDLLGISPRPASLWSGEQRASARRVIASSLDEEAAQRADDAMIERGLTSVSLAPFRDELARDQVVMQALVRWDDRLAEHGSPAHALLRVAVTPGLASFAIRGTSTAASQASARAISLQLAPAWSEEPLVELTDRGAGELAQLARDAGHTSGPVIAVPAPRLAVLGAYLEKRGELEARLLVNPVLLAALEPHSGDALGALPAAGPGGDGAPSGEASAGGGGEVGGGGQLVGGGEAQVAPSIGASAIGGNPYSFYGSVAECAAAQRLRCESCMPAGNCEAITEIPDGDAECVALAAEEGRGYFLQCINLSLAITSVDECTAEQASSCPRVAGAARSLSTLAANANFLDEETCQLGLNRCLARIFGAPKGEFPPGPGGGDGGGSPPRDIDVSCDNSCDDDNNNGNCSADPSCECTGPSCDNSFSCDSTCSNSNDQDGCGDSGGDDSGCSGGGGCSGDDGQSDGSCSDSDDGGCGGSDGSGGGGGSGDSSSCGGGGDGCGGSGDSSCGGSGDSSCGGGGDCGGNKSSGGGCSVAAPAKPRPSKPPAGLSFLLMGLWGLAPIPAAMIARRRARRGETTATETAKASGPTPAPEEAAPSEAAAADEEVAR
jgi:hypothetical protein